MPVRDLYFNPMNGYRIIACETIDDRSNIELNRYGNFTISGNNLASYKLGQPILLEIEPKENAKYQGEYKCLGYGGIKIEHETSNITIDPSQERAILLQFMSMGQADNVLEAYPNFVEMVLNGRANEFDTNKIYNVGKVRIAEYIDKVKNNCDMIFFNKDCWAIGIDKEADIERIKQVFGKSNLFISAFQNKPYETLCDDLEFDFNKADRIVLKNFSFLEDSYERCKYFCIDMLKVNEQSGDTRINPNIISRYLKANMPILYPYIVDVIKHDDAFYYDDKLKFCSLKSTYMAEKNIADNIKHRLKLNESSGEYDEEFIEQFRTIGDMSLTDEQMKILKLMDKGWIAVLSGPGGCVDCDTEFFTGYGWKRIADYTQGDKVLQYNEDSTAELVDPVRYIKEPCNNLWHFETKYGINQTLCDEHRIVYWSRKGKQHECNIKDIIEKQSIPNATGWEGRFKTSFKYGGKGIDLTDAEIKVMCAVICDGNFPKKSTNNYCRFHIKKDRKKERLREIFTDANIEWHEATSAAEGYIDFYIYAPRREKEFTEYWYDCNNHQLQVICDNILFWDGSTNKTKTGKERKQFSTNIKSTAEFVQFAYTACGYRATIGTRDRSGQKYFTCGKWYTRKSVEYNVIITDRIFVGICSDYRAKHKKTQITQVPTVDGFKYCFTVPSGMLVLRRKDCIFITGNCGKSASTKALIRMLEAKGKSYTLLAPTGVSAKVLKNMTGRHASTVHMFLARQEPAGEYIVVDEASMLTVALLSKLFSYIGESTKVVFVCDENQLPSIGAGNVVHDLIHSGKVPVAMLTKIFRYNSSGIITNVTDVRQGNFSHADEEYDDFVYMEANAHIEDQLLWQYQNYLDQDYKMDDILILSPFRVGDFGSHAINNIIQENYNNHPKTEAEIKVDGITICFKVGDRVINTKNNYNAIRWDVERNSYEYVEDDEGNLEVNTTAIYNGDLGKIVDVRKSQDNIIQVIVQWDDAITCVEGTEINNLLLGYCVTIHKCVTGDTLIYTNEGIKTIKEVYEKNSSEIKIYNGDSFEKPINFVKNIPLPCKTITLKNGAKITGTLEHGLTTVDKNGQLSRANVNEVKEGDWLALRIGSNVYGTKIDLSEYKVRRDSRENSNIVIPNCLSEDLAVFLGIMCADGTVYKGGFRFAKRNEEVVDCAIKVAIKEFNALPKKYYKIEKSRGKNGAWYGEVNSTGLSRWLLTLGGLAPNNKYVPNCILEAPKNIQRKFLKGLFEDGTVNIKKEKFDHIEFTTASQKCAQQVQTMLLNMGICSYVKKYGEKEIFHLYIYRKDAIKFKEEIGFISFSKQERLDKYLKEHDVFHSCDNTYIPNIRELCKQAFDKIGKKQFSKKIWDAVHLYTSEITRGLAYKISENLIDKNNELSNYLLFLYNNYAFFPVTNIKDCIEETYCFEMPKTHQFVQNGFMGWNCQGAQSKVVITLINRKGRDEFINRNILYVALSRAQEQLAIIANKNLIEEGLEYQANLTRETWLEDMLNE